MRPLFVEEPVPQENVAALRQVAERAPVPIATGERLLTRWGFREICEQQAAAYLQPDVTHVGGITELKKVANLAEVYYMHIAPHCAIGPVALAAALPCGCGGAKLSDPGADRRQPGRWALREPWLVRDGHIELPTRPGLGFEIDEREAEQHRVYQEELGGEFYYPADGSVADW